MWQWGTMLVHVVVWTTSRWWRGAAEKEGCYGCVSCSHDCCLGCTVESAVASPSHVESCKLNFSKIQLFKFHQRRVSSGFHSLMKHRFWLNCFVWIAKCFLDLSKIEWRYNIFLTLKTGPCNLTILSTDHCACLFLVQVHPDWQIWFFTRSKLGFFYCYVSTTSYILCPMLFHGYTHR